MSQMVTATALARHLDISRQRVMQLLDDGALSRPIGKLFDVDASRLAYIRWLRDDQRRVTKTVGANRVSDARARKIELEIAREEHRIIDIDEHDAVVDEIVGMFSVGLDSLPAQAASDATLRGTMKSACADLSWRIAERAAERNAQLRSTGEAIDTPLADDA